MSFLTEINSIVRRQAHPQQIRERVISKSLYLVSAFIEGFVKFPYDAHAYFYFQSKLDLSPQAALQCYHLQCSLFFFWISLPPVAGLVKPKYSYWAMIIFSWLSFVGFAILVLVSYPFKHAFFQNNKYYFIMSAMSFTSSAYGGKWYWTRRTIYEQYRFPKELDEYVRGLLGNIFSMNVGRIIGMIVTNYVSRNGPEINCVRFYSVLVAANLLESLVLSFGLLTARKGTSSHSTAGDMIRNDVNMFFRRSKLPENSVARSIASILPLFIPLLFIQGYRHQKFSRFVRQAEMLDLQMAWDWGYTLHPTMMNIVQPIVIVLLVYPFQLLLDFLWGYRITFWTPTRTQCAFTFIALSFLAGSLVQVFVEDRADESIKLEHGCVVVYNTLECVAFAKTKFHHSLTINPMSHIMLKSTSRIDILNENGSPLNIEVNCGATNYSAETKMSVEKMQISEYLLLALTDGENVTGAELIQISPRRIKSTFFFANTVRLVYSTPFNVTIGGQMTKYYAGKYGSDYANQLEIFPDGRYHVAINGLLLHELKITKGTSLTILISKSFKKQLQAVPLSRIIEILPPNVVKYYYQIPQLVLQGLADLMVDTPGFIYASNLVVYETHEALQLMWFLTQGVANLLAASTILEFQTSVYNYLMGFTISVWSTVFFVQVSKHFYKTDYEVLPERQSVRKHDDGKKIP